MAPTSRQSHASAPASRALDARCYEGGGGRTRYHVPHVGPRDAGFAAGCAAWVVLLAVL